MNVIVLLSSLLIGAGMPATVHPPSTIVHVISGVADDGRATDEWLAILRQRLAPDRYDSVAGIRKPLTTQEAAWAKMIRARATAWQQMVPALAELFAPISPPGEVTIVMGNRGGEDAFTVDARTIGFDVSALQMLYGDAQKEENGRRIDSFFRHEFTHVLQKPWLQAHPWASDSPLRAALLDIWEEGLGNYQSLSAQWLSTAGKHSPRAAQALAELEPRMIVRLAALACASLGAARPLAKDLSSGRFDQKWGAVTAALWLESAPEGAAAAMRAYVLAGPAGFWDLADRNLAPGLRPTLHEVQSAEAICEGHRG
jgi:hypothetical protein